MYVSRLVSLIFLLRIDEYIHLNLFVVFTKMTMLISAFVLVVMLVNAVSGKTFVIKSKQKMKITSLEIYSVKGKSCNIYFLRSQTFEHVSLGFRSKF